MSVLSYNRLVQLVEAGVLKGVDPAHINAASIDITLGPILLVESYTPPSDGFVPQVIDTWTKDSLHFKTVNLAQQPDQSYVIRPGECLLAQSTEVFHLPNNIACEFKLKSSMARKFLDHMLAGWCDPGFNNSVLTLEFRNLTTYHDLRIKLGQRIGQLVFFDCDTVPENKSYATVGSYNGQMQTAGGLTASKGEVK